MTVIERIVCSDARRELPMILAEARAAWERGIRGSELVEVTRLGCARSVCAVMAANAEARS
jgi:hypothetical protein